MKKILAVTSGKFTPSARYRVRQHIPNLNKMGLDIVESCPLIEKNKSVPYLKNVNPRYYLPIYGTWQLLKTVQRLPSVLMSYKYDHIWLNRELLTGYYTLEPLYKKNIVLDVDDAIWLNPPFGKYSAKKLAQRSESIICGNEYLAEWFSQYNSQCHIIPTAVDTDYLCPTFKVKKDEIIMGWIGTHGNLKYIKGILQSLLYVLNKNKNVSLLIVSDQMPDFINEHERIIFEYWSAEKEQENFQSIDIGLMPLADDEWSKGKCSYKLLQHMSCGCPVVGSPVGMNDIVLRPENGGFQAKCKNYWVDILDTLISDHQLRKSSGILARKYILENYSNQLVQEKLAKIFLR